MFCAIIFAICYTCKNIYIYIYIYIYIHTYTYTYISRAELNRDWNKLDFVWAHYSITVSSNRLNYSPEFNSCDVWNGPYCCDISQFKLWHSRYLILQTPMSDYRTHASALNFQFSPTPYANSFSTYPPDKSAIRISVFAPSLLVKVWYSATDRDPLFWNSFRQSVGFSSVGDKSLSLRYAIWLKRSRLTTLFMLPHWNPNISRLVH